MAIIIKEFNLLYKHPNFNYNTYVIFLRQLFTGQPAANPIIMFTTPASSQLSKIKYSTCGLPHKL